MSELTKRERVLMGVAFSAGSNHDSLESWLDERVSDCGRTVQMNLIRDLKIAELDASTTVTDEQRRDMRIVYLKACDMPCPENWQESANRLHEAFFDGVYENRSAALTGED